MPYTCIRVYIIMTLHFSRRHNNISYMQKWLQYQTLALFCLYMKFNNLTRLTNKYSIIFSFGMFYAFYTKKQMVVFVDEIKVSSSDTFFCIQQVFFCMSDLFHSLFGSLQFCCHLCGHCLYPSSVTVFTKNMLIKRIASTAFCIRRQL